MVIGTKQYRFLERNYVSYSSLSSLLERPLFLISDCHKQNTIQHSSLCNPGALRE